MSRAAAVVGVLVAAAGSIAIGQTPARNASPATAVIRGRLVVADSGRPLTIKRSTV
jgi:hypothetical protein